MSPHEIRETLRTTLDDARLSRSERRALAAVLGGLDPDPATLALCRSIAFELAREALDATNGPAILGWLEEVSKLLADAGSNADAVHRVDCWFSPDPRFGTRIAGFLDRARRSVEICIFNLTHDVISNAIAAAHRRGVRVRLLTDDETPDNTGSDVDSLRRAGIEVRMDDTDAEMHHKFAIFDGETLLTGSSNWTRAAETRNRDNFVVTTDPRLVRPFATYFERLWDEFQN